MEEQHYDALQELATCRFVPGSYDKRFVRDLAMKSRDAELTPKQINFLKKTYYKYRKQIMSRNPDAEFDWTFDLVEVPSISNPDKVVIVCKPPNTNRLSQEELEQVHLIHKRYGKIPGNIADYWK